MRADNDDSTVVFAPDERHETQSSDLGPVTILEQQKPSFSTI